MVAYLLYKNRKKIQTEVKLPGPTSGQGNTINIDSGLTKEGKKLVEKVVNTSLSNMDDGCVKMG